MTTHHTYMLTLLELLISFVMMKSMWGHSIPYTTSTLNLLNRVFSVALSLKSTQISSCSSCFLLAEPKVHLVNVCLSKQQNSKTFLP